MSIPPLESARSLAPRARALRSATEEERRLPEPIVRELIESGLCRIALPADAGGLELDPVEALAVYETLARAEASMAWIVWNNSLPCYLSRFLAKDARKAVFGDPGGFFASSSRPSGIAATDGDNFRVSGRWALVSGCVHASWVGLMCAVENDGEVEMLDGDMPHLRMAFLPTAECQRIDTWHVGGLRGTGSHDLSVSDVPVPATRTAFLAGTSSIDAPIGRIPISTTMSAGHAAICVGIARAAADAVIELGKSKVSVDPVPDMRDRPGNQRIVSETTTKIDAMYARLRDALGRLWEAARRGSDWTMSDIADVWSASVVTQIECKNAVTQLYEAGGTTSLYTHSVIERCHRDIHAATQHVVAQPLWLEEAGRVKLGLEPTNPLFAI